MYETNLYEIWYLQWSLYGMLSWEFHVACFLKFEVTAVRIMVFGFWGCVVTSLYAGVSEKFNVSILRAVLSLAHSVRPIRIGIFT